ncbi:MAG TPA: hypothetical protein VI454_06400 [Verrucomicrobiae bacterium]|jgi:hypothetical protein
MDDLIPFASREYFFFLALLAVARALDFFSTWVATPHLVLEGNPIARRLGWKWGSLLNAGLCAGFALSPMTAIILSTTSVLVAARNFHSAWLMRAMGESEYRLLVSDQLARTGRKLYLFCMYAQALLTAAVGVALVGFGDDRLIPVSIGLGVVAYGFAVAFFSTLSVWRIRRGGG